MALYATYHHPVNIGAHSLVWDSHLEAIALGRICSTGRLDIASGKGQLQADREALARLHASKWGI